MKADLKSQQHYALHPESFVFAQDKLGRRVSEVKKLFEQIRLGQRLHSKHIKCG
jgi:hypothetical protein